MVRHESHAPVLLLGPTAGIILAARVNNRSLSRKLRLQLPLAIGPFRWTWFLSARQRNINHELPTLLPASTIISMNTKATTTDLDAQFVDVPNHLATTVYISYQMHYI
jgi:hypothetical protein